MSLRSGLCDGIGEVARHDDKLGYRLRAVDVRDMLIWDFGGRKLWFYSFQTVSRVQRLSPGKYWIQLVDDFDVV